MAPRLLHYSDIENAYDDPDRIGRLAGLLTARRDAETLVLGTGDNTAPGVLALVTRGAQALDFYRAVEPDAETFGNHDFDFGPERTRDIVRDSPQRWLTANVRANGDRFGRADGVERTAVFEVADARVGLFGVTDPTTPSLNPKATGLTFSDPIAAAREAVADLRERGVDHVVALSHLGRGDETLAAEVDVDVILGGHVHAERVERVHDTLLTRPGVNGEVVLEVSLPDRSVTRHEVADAPRHEGVAGALRARMATAGVHHPVAHVAEPIERTEKTAFRGESRVGNFVADAYRWAALEADAADGLPRERVVALQNSGGIRAGTALDGDVTLADLISLVPFEEPVAVVELSGERLRETFAQAAGSRLGFGHPEWWHAHLANAHVTYDFERHAVVDARVGGEPLDPDAIYRLATSDYLLHTTNEFPALGEDDRVATLDTQYEVLAAYARTVGIAPELEGRIVHQRA
jgi:2',3'-cyclic-nucleotide 2'-phosphodiesterase (5'-nucleotidase family)